MIDNEQRRARSTLLATIAAAVDALDKAERIEGDERLCLQVLESGVTNVNALSASHIDPGSAVALLREAYTRLMVSEGDARYIDNNIALATRIAEAVDV